jgi:hypothetical protein
MNQQEWEQDILNRQRNIVFPDTNLNEGRFYRNIASGKAVFSRGQKVSLAIMVAVFTILNALQIAAIISGEGEGFLVGPAGISMAWLGFWIFLAMNAFFPPKLERKYRRGYRTSRR